VSHADEKEIAKAFPIRCSTVHHYLVGIYEKPGVHNLENARRELRRRI
jgi:DNA-binding NarL/FixJ family response regulator